jgi:hypothetical protein
LENNSRKPKNLFKGRHSDSLNKSTYSFSGMIQKGNVIDDADDDDEVKTSAHRTVQQQHCSLRNSSLGLCIYSSSLNSAEMCAGGRK